MVDKSQRPFRFQAKWMSHAETEVVIAMPWNGSNGDIVFKSGKLEERLREWNPETFGTLFGNKKRLRARIRGVQRDLAQYRSQSLEDLEERLVREYIDIPAQEQLFWAQKAEVKWIQQEQEELRGMAVEFYEDLHSLDCQTSENLEDLTCHRIKEKILAFLDNMISIGEVHAALFLMKPLKAPGVETGSMLVSFKGIAAL